MTPTEFAAKLHLFATRHHVRDVTLLAGRLLLSLIFLHEGVTLATHFDGAAKAMAADVMSMVKADGGKHVVDTVGGCKLTLQTTADGKGVTVTDENGNVANVTIADVVQSNGVIHVIDKVLLPKM